MGTSFYSEFKYLGYLPRGKSCLRLHRFKAPGNYRHALYYRPIPGYRIFYPRVPYFKLFFIHRLPSLQIGPACNTYIITASITDRHVIQNASSAQRNSLRTDRLYIARQLILRRRDTGLRSPVLIRRMPCVPLMSRISLTSPLFIPHYYNFPHQRAQRRDLRRIKRIDRLAKVAIPKALPICHVVSVNIVINAPRLAVAQGRLGIPPFTDLVLDLVEYLPVVRSGHAFVF